MGGSGKCARAATAKAVFQMRFSSVAGIRCASRPVTRIESRLLTEKRHSRYTFRAIASESKPGPRFALDPGTRRVLAGVKESLCLYIGKFFNHARCDFAYYIGNGSSRHETARQAARRDKSVYFL